MADISADSLLPSGEFKATSCSGILSIVSGSSGTIATLTSTGGRKIRLTLLSLLASTGSEAGISVIADGVTVISGTLSATPQIGFSVGGAALGNNSYIGPIRHIEAFNTITITKTSGSTTFNIYYATEQGF